MRSLVVLSTLAASASAAIQKTSGYDYIVIGGGTSGLTVANRLSEDASSSVLVIEAGGSVYNDPQVYDVNGYGLALGSSIDWAYSAVNQTYGGNTQQTLRAGKALGGTSTINGMVYARAEDAQIDAWATIGNPSWSWNSLLPYYIKSENLTYPNAEQVAAGAAYDPAYNGEDGPLKVAFKPSQSATDFITKLNQSISGLGLPPNPDINTGHMRGFSVTPVTIDYDKQVREDAARAYYYPFAASRHNLNVLLGTSATRITWGIPRSGQATANGVEVALTNGTVQVLKARREVIVSAGALRSPGILEHSGIGNPGILSEFGIPVVVNLPTVGENMQDQTTTDMAPISHDIVNGGSITTYATAQDIFGNETQSIRDALQTDLPKFAAQAADASGGTMKASDLERLFETQFDLIFEHNTPIAEVILGASGSTSISAEYWGLLPFARGSVHISSANPLSMPTINPNYFMYDYDLKTQIAIARYIRSIFASEPINSLVAGESSPGFDAVPEGGSDEEWKAWLFGGYCE